MLRGMRLLEMEQRIDHFQYVMLIGGLFSHIPRMCVTRESDLLIASTYILVSVRDIMKLHPERHGREGEYV